MAKIVLEIIHDADGRKETRSFDAGCVTIGRGYDNDVVLADPYVSSQHARIRVAGEGWDIEDTQSDNGIYFEKAKHVLPRAFLASGDSFVIGTTRITVFSAMHPVPPAQPLARFSWGYRLLGKPVVSVGLLCALALLVATQSYLQSFDDAQWWQKAGIGIISAGMISLLAGVWALIGVIVRRKSRYALQIGITSFGFIIMLLAYEVLAYGKCYTASPRIAKIPDYLFFGIWFGLMLNSWLATATLAARNKRLTWALIAGIGLIAGRPLLDAVDAPDFRQTPWYTSGLKPPGLLWTPAQPVERFIDSSGHVFELRKELSQKHAKIAGSAR